jgi:hypothetical protein
LIMRPERTEDENNLMIYLFQPTGWWKDASVWDRLAAEKDVLCFKMKAAELINHFPRLAIRGICDYSDSYENKKWQGYAAMMTAAYSKDLLCRIPPNKVEAENRLSDLLSS